MDVAGVDICAYDEMLRRFVYFSVLLVVLLRGFVSCSMPRRRFSFMCTCIFVACLVQNKTVSLVTRRIALGSWGVIVFAHGCFLLRLRRFM